MHVLSRVRFLTINYLLRLFVPLLFVCLLTLFVLFTGRFVNAAMFDDASKGALLPDAPHGASGGRGASGRGGPMPPMDPYAMQQMGMMMPGYYPAGPGE